MGRSGETLRACGKLNAAAWPPSSPPVSPCHALSSAVALLTKLSLEALSAKPGRTPASVVPGMAGVADAGAPAAPDVGAEPSTRVLLASSVATSEPPLIRRLEVP